MRINQLRENNYIDSDEASDHSNGLIQPTQRNIKRFVNFLREKWNARSKERYDSWGDAHSEPWSPPDTLEGACKFTSLFANKLFGGRMRGNEHHQYLELPNGKIIDPVPVPEIDDPQYHDEKFWMNPDHKDSMESCLPRVNEWIREFMSLNEVELTELTKGVKKGSQKREKIGFATDDPSKYVGKWEKFSEPQGINSKAGKKMTKTEGLMKREIINLYRGINSGQEGNSYYTTDRDWVRQFTQSGRDSEIKSVRYSTNRIFKNDPLPRAYVLDNNDIEIMNSAWDEGYKGVWMDEGDGQPDSVYFMRERPSELLEGFSLGPGMTRGLSNSSTGLGSAPPQIDITQTPWQKKTNGKKKMAGNKAPTFVVKKNVNKSTKNKIRKLDSPVTEVFGDPSNSFPYEKDPSGWFNINAGIDSLEIVVGMEDISNYNPSLPPGVNVGMVTMDAGGMHLGIEPEKLGMTTQDTIKLFNTLMNIVREYVETNNPDRLYFIAVKPMEGIYKRLIKRFVNPDVWSIKIIKDVPIPMLGGTLNAYMIEKKEVVTEMFRTPKHKELNADYEVEDGDEIVAKGRVNFGVIDDFMVRDDIKNNDFRGKYMSGLMSAIVRDADMTNSNMSMQIFNKDDMEMKRFLERFGFRHVGDGVFKRTAGAITPPSVVY